MLENLVKSSFKVVNTKAKKSKKYISIIFFLINLLNSN